MWPPEWERWRSSGHTDMKWTSARSLDVPVLSPTESPYTRLLDYSHRQVGTLCGIPSTLKNRLDPYPAPSHFSGIFLIINIMESFSLTIPFSPASAHLPACKSTKTLHDFYLAKASVFLGHSAAFYVIGYSTSLGPSIHLASKRPLAHGPPTLLTTADPKGLPPALTLNTSSLPQGNTSEHTQSFVFKGTCLLTSSPVWDLPLALNTRIQLPI